MRKFFNRLHFLLSGILLVMVFSLTACSSTRTLEPAPEGYSFIEPPSEEQIYGRLESSSMHMTNNPEQIANWYCDVIVVGKFLGNTDTFMLDSDIPMIYTRGLFEVTDVLKGNYDEEYIEAAYYGGIISIAEYIDSLSPVQLKNYGLDQISESNCDNLYIEERESENSAEPEPAVSYILLLAKSDDGYYTIQSGALGMLPYQDGKAYDYATNSYKTFSFME